MIWILNSNRFNSAITEWGLASARALSEQGRAKVVLTLLHGSPSVTRARSYGLLVRTLSSFHLGKLWSLIREARRLQGQHGRIQGVLVCQGPEEVLMGILAFFGLVPRPLRFLGYYREGRKRRGLLAYRHHALTNSVTLARLWEPVVTKRESRLTVVELGNLQKACPREDRCRVLLTVGRLDPVKGYDRAAQQWSQALKLEPEKKDAWLLVGEPANQSVADLLGIFASYGLSFMVLNSLKELESFLQAPQASVGLFAHRHPQIQELMARVTLGWIPSVGSEWIARVGVEFLGTGTPLVVTDVGSLKDLGTEQDVVVDRERSPELLNRVYHQAQAEDVSQRLKRCERAKKRYSFSHMAQGLWQVFTAVQKDF